MEKSFSITDSKLSISPEFIQLSSRSNPPKSVVEILGFQSTGKSTLLNQILQNRIFEVETDKHLAMYRTTRGLIGFDTEKALFIDSEGFSSASRDDRLNLFDNTIIELSSILSSVLIIMVNYNDHTSKLGFIKTYLSTLFRSTLKRKRMRKQKLIITICNTAENLKIGNDVKNKVYEEWSRAIKGVERTKDEIFNSYFEIDTEFVLFDHVNDQFYEENVELLKNKIEIDIKNYDKNLSEVCEEIENYKARIEDVISENYSFLLDFLRESVEIHEEKCSKILKDMEKIKNHEKYLEKYEQALTKSLQKIEFVLQEDSLEESRILRENIKEECENLIMEHEKGIVILQHYFEWCYEKLNEDFSISTNHENFLHKIKTEIPLLLINLNPVVYTSLESEIEEYIYNIENYCFKIIKEYKQGSFQLNTLLDSLNLSFNEKMICVHDYLHICSTTEETFLNLTKNFTLPAKTQLLSEMSEELLKLNKECQNKIEEYAIADNELLRFKIDLLKIKFSWVDIYLTTPIVNQLEQKINNFFTQKISYEVVRREIIKKKNFYKRLIVEKIDKAQIMEYIKAGLILGTSVIGGFAVGAAIRAVELATLGTEAGVVGAATSVAIGTGIGSGALGLTTLILSLENLENFRWSHSSIVEENGWFERIEEIGGEIIRTKIIKRELINYIRNTNLRPLRLMNEIDREYGLKNFDIEEKIDQVLRDYNFSN